jgi:hypothetical protein
MNQEHAMRYRHRMAALGPATAIGAAGLAAAVVLAGATGTVSVATQPLAPADVYLHQPPPAGPRAIVTTGIAGDGHGPKAVVVTGGDPGNGNGPKAIIIGDPGGDGPGPKAREST